MCTEAFCKWATLVHLLLSFTNVPVAYALVFHRRLHRLHITHGQADHSNYLFGEAIGE